MWCSQGSPPPGEGFSRKCLHRAFHSLPLLGKEGVRSLSTDDAFGSEMAILTVSAWVGFSEVDAEMEFGAQVFMRINTWEGWGGSHVLRVMLGCDTGVVGSTEQGLPTSVSSVGLKWPGYIRPPGFVTQCRL